MPSLFDSAQMGATSVENRVFMAPLTRNRANADGIPSDMAAEYYAQRASGGLLIAEATQISPMGKGYINTPGIHNDDQTQTWKNITKAVHDKDGKIFLQLWHVGRISHTSLLPNEQAPLAPSAIQAKAQTFIETGMVDVSEPQAMTLDDIKQTIEDYKQAAIYAKEAGFDGIEVHAANGYLIDQFIQDKSNQRDDSYGGSIENRMRFLMEVLDAVLDVWNKDQVGVRLSPTGTFNDMGDGDIVGTFGAIIKRLNDYELAYLHMVEEFPGMHNSSEEDNLVKKLRNMWNGFYIANGGYSRDEALDVIESGYADAITFGRPFISNPDLPKRLEINAELAMADESKFYGGGAEGYIDYPPLKETEAA